YQPAIGVGECAGVIIDLVATLLYETEEKIQWADENFEAGAWADAIYHSYAVFINAAKALLLDRGINSSTQVGVISSFDESYVQTGEVQLGGSFSDMVLQIKQNEPSEAFARSYLNEA